MNENSPENPVPDQAENQAEVNTELDAGRTVQPEQPQPIDVSAEDQELEETPFEGEPDVEEAQADANGTQDDGGSENA